MSTPWEGGSDRVRTSDAEREEVATILRAAVTEGRLTLEEGDERLARTYAAKYREDLRPLTADLPGGGREALWRTPEVLGAMRRRLRLHGVGALVLAGILVGLWVLSGAHFFWPLLPLIILAISFRRHARFVRYGPWWGRGPWGRGPWGPGPWGHGWGRGDRA
jgi:hypothetical protein